MSTDWHVWREEYDDPQSSLSRRRATVRAEVRRLPDDGATRFLSICAGDGRDLLPEPAATDHALLVELDPRLAATAREESAGLPGVQVLAADAGLAAVCPAEAYDVVTACGLLGNITDADARTTTAFLATRISGCELEVREVETG